MLLSSDDPASGVKDLTILGVGRRHVYPAISKCIYCGDTKSKLTEEHIVPLSLGGNVILPAASCFICQVVINKEIEQPITDIKTGVYGPLRLKLGLPTRNPKRRPNTIPVSIVSDDGSTRIVDLDKNNLPTIITGITTTNEIPKILMDPDEAKKCRAAPYFRASLDHMLGILKDGDIIKGLGAFDAMKILRLVAKIAHGVACATHLEGFHGYLPYIILGKYSRALDFISSERTTEPDYRGMHHIQTGWLMPEGKYLVARVRLFAPYCGPMYTVLVGEQIGPPE